MTLCDMCGLRSDTLSPVGSPAEVGVGRVGEGLLTKPSPRSCWALSPWPGQAARLFRKQRAQPAQ